VIKSMTMLAIWVAGHMCREIQTSVLMTSHAVCDRKCLFTRLVVCLESVIVNSAVYSLMSSV